MGSNQQVQEKPVREQIDQKLALAGCIIQNKTQIYLYKSLGITVREMDIKINTSVAENTDRSKIYCEGLSQYDT